MVLMILVYLLIQQISVYELYNDERREVCSSGLIKEQRRVEMELKAKGFKELL